MRDPRKLARAEERVRSRSLEARAGLFRELARSNRTGAGGAPLGSYARNFSPPPEADALRDRWDALPRRVRRHRMREAHRTLARSKNQRKCGLVRIDPEVDLRRRLDAEEGHGGHFHGLVRCGSWSSCPVCSLAISQHRGEEIQAAIDAHQQAGGFVLLLTLTLPHEYEDRLEDLYPALSDAYGYLKVGTGWAGGVRSIGWKRRLGYEGAIRGVDATHGRNGWHVHIHALWFLAGPPSDELLEEFGEWVFARWERRLERHGITGLVKEHAVSLVGGQHAGYYVAKMGLARELSSIHTKEGRGGNRTPFQVLEGVAAANARGDYRSREARRDCAIWAEWIDAMQGKSQAHWSKGLRARLLPDEEELSDEEIVAGEDGPEEVVARFDGPLWDRIAEAGDLRAELEAIAGEPCELEVRRALVAAAVGRAVGGSSGPSEGYRAALGESLRAMAVGGYERAGRELERDRRAADRELREHGASGMSGRRRDLLLVSGAVPLPLVREAVGPGVA